MLRNEQMTEWIAGYVDKWMDGWMERGRDE